MNSNALCVVCNRAGSISTGRYVDGTWVYDSVIRAHIPEAWGRWVCCWRCYRRLYDLALAVKRETQRGIHGHV